MRAGTRQALTRLTLISAMGLGLAACEPRQNPSGTVDLPPETTRYTATQQRNAQLATGEWRDDIPEYTGAPDPRGRWPAQASTGRTVYRDDAGLEVGSEGPYARVGG